MNKNIFLAIALIGILFSISFSQEQPAETKKILKGEDEKLYINKDLPVYLWISASPDENSRKVRLKSEVTSDYSNPMYFDTEGYNTVRSPWCIDTNTKKAVYPQQDIIFEVYADGHPPVTKSNFTAESKAVSGNKNLYGKNLKIELSAQDAVSGIDNVYYSLDGAAFKSYSAPLSVDKEGNHTFKYYATDIVGNREELKEVEFSLDFTPPISSYEIEGLVNDTYVSPDAKIKLISEDSISGVKNIYYSINNGSQKIYSTPVPVTLLTSSDGVIIFYAVDNAGNKESKKRIGGASDRFNLQGDRDDEAGSMVFEFYVDQDPPAVSLEMKGDSYQKENYMYISSRNTFEIKADDDKSGVDKSYYSINSTAVNNEYNKPFSINESGLTTIRIKSVDFVGNMSPLKSYKYLVDATPPSTRLSIGEPKIKLRDTLYISKSTKLSVIASDEHSGVKEIMKGLNNGEMNLYKQSFTLDQEGINTVSYKATDNVNNKEEIKKQDIFVDNQPPEIYYHFSITPIGSKEVREDEYIIYPTTTELYLAATDIHAGGETIFYSVNGGTLKPYTSIKNLAPGNYTIKVVATDIMKNKSTEEIKFAIEK